VQVFGEQTDENVVREIGCVKLIAQPVLQPCQQPAMVIAVELLHIERGWRGGHGTEPVIE
jgi:hypothetical protein